MITTRFGDLLVVGILAIAMSFGGYSTVSGVERPNVVLVMTDDQGYGDVGVHGNDKIRTPNLDRFSEQGVTFTRFYCSPVCAPTRASLMTGRYYYRTGVVHTSRGGAKMQADEVTLAEMLSSAGYSTGLFGKWHLGDNYPMRPIDQGFDEVLRHSSGGIGQTPDKPNSYFDPLLWHNGCSFKAQGYCTDVFTDAAIEFIKTNRDGPFFVYLSTNTPHTPLEIADEYVERYRKMGLSETTARVYGMCENIDDNFGRLLATLDTLGLRDNTLIVFLTDNGPQQKRYTANLKGRKSWVYEGGIRVPCFVQWPGRFSGGRVVDRIAAHIDLLPTIVEACGVVLPKNVRIDGVSQLPRLSGTDTKLDDERLLFFQCHRGLRPQRYHNAAVVSQRFKLVMHPGTFGDEQLAVAGVGAGAGAELYDIARDPNEDRPLVNAKRQKQLVAAYNEWFDDVRTTRDFVPGRIIVGSDEENPLRLCRYQDGTYRGDGFSHGWAVEVVRDGNYKLHVDQGDVKQPVPGRIHVRWLERENSIATKDGQAVFKLGKGTGTLDIWFQADGETRKRIGLNTTEGNVKLQF